MILALDIPRTATVDGYFTFNLSTTDAEFGALDEDDTLSIFDVIRPNERNLSACCGELKALIYKDARREGLECFTLLITMPDSEDHPDIFRCLKDDDVCNKIDEDKHFFCSHTICIDDNHGLLS